MEWNKMKRPKVLKLNTLTIKLINHKGYNRYCVNMSDAARILGITPPALPDKITRGVLSIWHIEEKNKNSTKWIAIDTILNEVDHSTLPADLAIIVQSGLLHYDPYVELINNLLNAEQIDWCDLDPAIQKHFLKNIKKDLI